MTIENLHKSI